MGPSCIVDEFVSTTGVRESGSLIDELCNTSRGGLHVLLLGLCERECVPSVRLHTLWSGTAHDLVLQIYEKKN